MGSLCVVSDKEPDLEGEFARNNYDDRIPLTQHNQSKSDSDNDNDNNNHIEEDDAYAQNEEESESPENNGALNATFNAMQQEVVLLSTRNANLEQQLEDMKKKYNELKKVQVSRQNSQNSLTGLYGSQMVPIGYICDELEIDATKLSESIEMEELEALLAEIDSNCNLSEKQLKFIQSVSDDMDDTLLGLLNILVENKHYLIFYKCIVMEMISYIYHEPDDENENDEKDENKQNEQNHENDENINKNDENEQNGNKTENNNNNDKLEYDIQFIYEISDVLNISKDIINSIDSMIKQRLGSETKFENLFIENHDSQ